MVRHDVSGAGLVRGGRGADDSLSDERAAEGIALEEGLDDFRCRRLDREPEYVRHAGALRIGSDRCERRSVAEEERAQERDGSVPESNEPLVPDGLIGRETSQSIQGFLGIPPDKQGTAVRKGYEQLGVLWYDVQATALEFQFLPDFGSQEGQRIGPRGRTDAWCQLFGDAGAADQLAALAYQDGTAGTGDIRGGDEPVVAAADDHHIDRFRRHGNTLRAVEDETRENRRRSFLGMMENDGTSR